jgi:glutamate-1-semialdehyde aminotransferase
MGHNIPPRWPQGSMQHVYIRACNTGTRAWRSAAVDGCRADLLIRLKGELHGTIPVPHDVTPRAQVTFNFPFFVPLLFLKARDETEITFEIVVSDGDQGRCSGTNPLAVKFEIGPMEQDAAAESLQIAEVACNAFYLPSGRVSRGRDGQLFPLIAHSAAGCRIRDMIGNEWIDYVMGWGSALLGYACPEIRQAIQSQLGSGAVLSLPNFIELEVAQLLGEIIPCAQATLFGKNGSDVCTAAVRMARIHTGRPKILFTGYSGWQEPFAQAFEPALAQAGHPHGACQFPAENLEQVQNLFDEHPGQIAAVMLEPAAQVESVDGPVRGANPHFLKALSQLCREKGALLIFDEIFTGFRHPGQSVQKATGVVPDLACFGKALSGGMPLSVLVGRRDVMRSVARIFYHPTFKGEAYSFAAAAAALKMYQQHDVPAQIARFGHQLTNAVNELSRRLEVTGEMVGPPFRMLYRFNDPDMSRRMLLRTLLLQELLKRGVLPFRNCFLPSTAHGDSELQQTIDAFEGALRRVRDVSARNSFERELEIPPVL